MSPVRLLIDTDTAGDDVFSLLLALRHPGAQLEAITIVCGNVRFEHEVENALYTIEMAGRSGEVPVYAGCEKPLIADWVGAEYVHGPSYHTKNAKGKVQYGQSASMLPGAEYGELFGKAIEAGIIKLPQRTLEFLRGHGVNA